MAGNTSWIISNLLSSLERLPHFMSNFSSLDASSSSTSSSIVGEDITAAEVNSIQERSMEGLKRLSRMLQRIQAALHDAEKREIFDKTIQLWVNELRKVAYEAEDVLDQYDYQVIKAQVEGMTTTVEAEPSFKGKQVDHGNHILKDSMIELKDVAYHAEVIKIQVKGKSISAEEKPSLKRKRVNNDDDIYGCQDNYDQVSLPSSTSIKIPISSNMAMRIIKIVENFDEIAKDKKALKLREEDAPRRPYLDDAIKRPPSSSIMDDFGIFGREDEKKKLIQLLISRSEENTVIPIVGLGGVGKTTLAQLVYNDPMVCQHFNPKAWVCVSEEFDVLRVTKEILKSITKSSIPDDNNNLNDLQCMLKQALLKKRFLLILDDVWNERRDMWEALRAPFSGIGMGKIIVTTRSMSIARIIQTVPPHLVTCLDEEKSWLLFQSHAFCGWELDQQLNFEQLGRGIIEKCGGLPLALKAIGGFLQYEVEEQKWKDVLNNNLWELEETKNLILPALRISYNHLPTHLKPCFVYASLFPKDHILEKVELTRMWIAQGYIHLTGKERLLEDIALEFFEDLVRRSFFQCLKYDKGFTLHDMMHDLARSISRNEIHSSLDFDELESIPKDAKHIFIHYAKVDHDISFGAIRTLLFNHNEIPHSIFSQKSFTHFGCLRVLTLYAPYFKCRSQVVNLIGNFKQLRYLFIKAASITMEKYSLCSLFMLQTLILISERLNMLPHAIGKLINLRHLMIRCNNLKIFPISFFRLENLLTLSFGFFCFDFFRKCKIEVESQLFLSQVGQYSDIECLKYLMNLRGSLNIFEVELLVSREDAKRAMLHNKPHIKSLTLCWGRYSETNYYIQSSRDGDYTKQEAILDGLKPHTNLEELTIEDYGGRKFPNWFGNPQFSKLTEVKLKRLYNEGCKFLPLNWLPSLSSLKISFMKGIRKMEHEFWCYNAPPESHENSSTDVHAGFHSVEYLSNISMPNCKVRPMMKNGNFSSLKCLHIERCYNLKLISTIPSSIEEFVVILCTQLEYIALHGNSGPLSRLQKVIFYGCFKLKSVISLNHCLDSLKSLNLIECFILEPNQDEYFNHSFGRISFQKDIARVIACPKMKEWCQCHGFTYKVYFQTPASLKELGIDLMHSEHLHNDLDEVFHLQPWCMFDPIPVWEEENSQ